MRKSKKKNTNQTDLFELVAHMEQLEQISSELTMIESLGQMELSTIVEKQMDWVDLDENFNAEPAHSVLAGTFRLSKIL